MKIQNIKVWALVDTVNNEVETFNTREDARAIRRIVHNNNKAVKIVKLKFDAIVR